MPLEETETLLTYTFPGNQIIIVIKDDNYLNVQQIIPSEEGRTWQNLKDYLDLKLLEV